MQKDSRTCSQLLTNARTFNHPGPTDASILATHQYHKQRILRTVELPKSYTSSFNPQTRFIAKYYVTFFPFNKIWYLKRCSLTGTTRSSPPPKGPLQQAESKGPGSSQQLEQYLLRCRAALGGPLWADQEELLKQGFTVYGLWSLGLKNTVIRESLP